MNKSDISNTFEIIIKKYVQDVPDFPKPGILFRDVSPVLADKITFRIAVMEMVRPWVGRVDHVAAIESRGFVFGTAVAQELGAGLLMLRKPGKLPPPIIEEKYDLEYGTDALQMKVVPSLRNARILIVDDVIATGGTAVAAAKLINKSGGLVVGLASLIDLPDLGGSERLRDNDIDVTSVITY